MSYNDEYNTKDEARPRHPAFTTRSKGPRKITHSFTVEVEQLEKLRELSARTHVPVAHYIREGINMLLKTQVEK
jgi:hypothetical protein